MTPTEMLAPDPREQAARNLCVFHESTLTPVAALRIDDADVTFDTMRKHHVHFQNVRAAGLEPTELRARGFDSLEHFRDVGMDALDLCDAGWTRSLVAAFGIDGVKSTFVRTPEDVNLLVGSEGARVLSLTLDEALEHCAGSPEVAAVVLIAQTNMPAALCATSVQRLLDTGLRAPSLTRLGLGVSVLVQHMGVTAVQAASLGFGALRL